MATSPSWQGCLLDAIGGVQAVEHVLHTTLRVLAVGLLNGAHQ